MTTYNNGSGSSPMGRIGPLCRTAQESCILVYYIYETKCQKLDSIASPPQTKPTATVKNPPNMDKNKNKPKKSANILYIIYFLKCVPCKNNSLHKVV